MQIRKSELSAAAITAVERGNLIEAIKITREETGLGLKDAKDVVDAYLAGNPAVKQRYEAAAAAQSAIFKRILLLVVAIAAAIAAYWFVTGRF